MRKEFLCFDDLISCVKEDKCASGSIATMANRFPIRFVLFDNFQDSYKFVSYTQDIGCIFKSVNDWLDKDYPDTILSYSELANHIIDYVASNTDDCLITPFSELARFYNNENSHKEFNALVKTIKGIENKYASVAKNRRIYIPIVGLEGKMSLFDNDSQCSIWYLKNLDKSLSYNLVLTNNTFFGIHDLSLFNLAHNVNEWLDVWKTQPAVKPIIICSSSALFANKAYALPDNAFNFITCTNAYEFLTNGLALSFGNIPYIVSEEKYWLQMAQGIDDIKSFSFDKFFNSYFHIDNLADYNVFLKIWFDRNDEFERWLLTKYYINKFCSKGYICKIIQNITGYTNNELFTAIALNIFSFDDSDTDIEERLTCLCVAQKYNVVLSQDTEQQLIEELVRLAETFGYATAIKYFSPLTKSEKALAIEWLASEKIQKESLQEFFPSLYNYLGHGVGSDQQWINTYFDDYRQAKIINKYTDQVAKHIENKNSSNQAFNSWYQTLKNTKTILSGRSDIDVFYWIDGLGVDWIPYIKRLFEQKQSDGIYLNEIFIARAAYPTTTSINKRYLLELSHNTLKKSGDLDSHAHNNMNEFPSYIIEELEIVNKAIDTIISEYGGKKIAIVSDHGLTALSQLCTGLNMAGVESDHYGRLAIRKVGKNVIGNDYIICEDSKTMCALKHISLCGKVPNGQSAHGGCTPEEILVPIFVISSNMETHHWKAILQTKIISETEPTVKYLIKGITSVDTPFIVYNGKQQELFSLGNGIYQSEKLVLSSYASNVKLLINDEQQIDTIEVKLGVIEDDLFNF